MKCLQGDFKISKIFLEIQKATCMHRSLCVPRKDENSSKHWPLAALEAPSEQEIKAKAEL